MWGWHGWWMWITPALLIALVAWIAYVAARGPRNHRQEGDAEELLRQRYAAGEIDEEEFERRLRILRRR